MTTTWRATLTHWWHPGEYIRDEIDDTLREFHAVGNADDLTHPRVINRWRNLLCRGLLLLLWLPAMAVLCFVACACAVLNGFVKAVFPWCMDQAKRRIIQLVLVGAPMRTPEVPSSTGARP